MRTEGRSWLHLLGMLSRSHGIKNRSSCNPCQLMSLSYDISLMLMTCLMSYVLYRIHFYTLLSRAWQRGVNTSVFRLNQVYVRAHTSVGMLQYSLGILRYLLNTSVFTWNTSVFTLNTSVFTYEYFSIRPHIHCSIQYSHPSGAWSCDVGLRFF